MRRITVVFSILISLFILIIIRLFYWQVFAADELRRDALNQHSTQFELFATRGKIVDAYNQPLILNQPAYLLFAEPKKIENPGLFVNAISGIIPVNQSQLLQMITEPGRVWVPIAHKVDASVADKLKSLEIKGLGFEKEMKRFYPEASMAAHILGFVGANEHGEDTGYFGIEGFYDRELSGKNGIVFQEKDVSGAPIMIGERTRIEPQDGSTIKLWLDRNIQYIVEEKLKQGIEKYGAVEGTVVVMDPKTGGILSLAAYPSYDPGEFKDYSSEVYKNSVVGSTYEPGSTFKVLVMAAGIEEHAVTPTSTMEENGPVQVGQYFIRTWNNKYSGNITMTDVLVHSSNVGMVYVQRRLKQDIFLSYLRNFGIGETTGIDLQEETVVPLRKDDEWKDIDLATASFGQGIAVTPLQMVRAVGSMANGGWLMQPLLVKEIEDGHGRITQIRPKKIRQVVSEKTANLITEMMVTTVENGEAKWAKPKGYRIAGKTGTAQIPISGHYDEEKTIASFVGFAPADNPKFVMLVTLREPSSSPWGSETAAPLFFSIAKELFGYWGIPAD